MNLDKIQVNACLRSGWQALDLGFLMARAWWRPLFLAGALPAFLLFVPLAILMPHDPYWVGFIVWWLLPFWERLPLYIASRKLFEENPAYHEVRTRARSLLFVDLIPTLLWRRLSMQRAFNAPVTVLEDLKGSNRSKRLQILHGKYADVALGNQFVCFCFEVIFMIGIVVLFDFFTPEKFDLQLYDNYGELTLAGDWIWTLAGFIAVLLIIPFHSMAGFALYLNRRIELEAWDIEISFRSLANRKRQSATGLAGLATAVLFVGLMAMSLPQTADAGVRHDRESASQLIEEVLQGESFGQEKIVRKWRFKDWGDPEDETFPEWIIDFIKWWEDNLGFDGSGMNAALWLKVILIVGFVVLMLYLLKRFQGPLGSLVRSRPEKVAPEVLFGLDVTPESLPGDVTSEVLDQWRKGNYREAIGLLYRASLSRLIDKHELAFRDSFTEAECAALVREQGIESLSRFFSELTQVWRRLAYGHQLPQSEQIEALCNGWIEELSDEPG